MTDGDLQIPRWMIAHLDRIPQDKPVAVLLRHSIRDRLPPGEAGNAVPITEDGKRLALNLGQMLKARLRTLHSSPVVRCMQTADMLKAGASSNVDIVPDQMLGDPGVFVVDGQLAWSNWQNLGHEGVVRHLISSNERLPGMARPDEAARLLVQHILAKTHGEPGLHIFVSHDILVMATVSWMLDKRLDMTDWPAFLEGAFFWTSSDGVHLMYRENDAVCVLNGARGLS